MTDYIKKEDARELFYMLLEQYHDTGVEVIKHTAAIAPKEFHVSEADDIADFNSEINGWKNDFSSIPSADVVQVVRCKDCIWLRYMENEEMEEFLDCDCPEGGGVPNDENFFCADGEMKGAKMEEDDK